MTLTRLTELGEVKAEAMSVVVVNRRNCYFASHLWESCQYISMFTFTSDRRNNILTTPHVVPPCLWTKVHRNVPLVNSQLVRWYASNFVTTIAKSTYQPSTNVELT